MNCFRGVISRQERFIATAALGLFWGCKGDLVVRDDTSHLRVASDVSCKSCAIVVKQAIQIPNADLSFRPFATLRDPFGNVLVTGADGLLRLYGANGQLIRQIGRRGGGPGEYETIRNVLVSSDSTIHVLDAQLGRHSRFSYTGAFIGSSAVPAAVGGRANAAALFLEQGVIIGTRPGAVMTPEGMAAQFVVVSDSGAVIHTLGRHIVDRRMEWRSSRLLVLVRRTGEVLIGEPYRFTLERYGSNLQSKGSVSRSAEWLPIDEPSDYPSDGVNEKPYTPSLMSVWEDAEGLVWLHMVLPADEWKPGPPESRNRTLSAAEYEALVRRPRVQTVVEAIDLRRGKVVSHFRVDGSLGEHIGGGNFAKRTNVSGIQIVSVTLRR